MYQDTTQEMLQWLRSHYFGKYRGTVVDTTDPTQRGRLQVRVPAVLGNADVWAMPCVPYAGAGVGFYCLPEPGTGVWVEFEGGDPSYPVWTGCFWGDGEIPDSPDRRIRVWKTEELTIRLDDGAGEMRVESSRGSKITLRTDALTESGGAKHTVGSSGVVSEQGASKTEVTQVSFRVNSGALEVM